MPVFSLNAWSRVTVRLVVTLCAVTLLASVLLPDIEPAAGADLSAAISAGRRSQQYYERAMLKQDRIVARTQTQVKHVRRAYKQAKKGVKHARRLLGAAKRNVRSREARLAKLQALYPSIGEAPKPWRYERRLKTARKNVRIAEARKRLAGKRVRSLIRARKNRLYRIRVLKRQRGAAIGQREAAEGGLAAHIVRMTSLAAARAEAQSAVQLSATSGAFSWPSVGRISQTYGCTGFYLSPRRGSCAHFHDGLDIVSGYGSPVRAAAMGVVAFVGWNPWDENGRAFIVVVAHPDGFVTRYGHLISRKRVRAGEVVFTGQAIGKMGNTGRSTGTHLHFELLKGGSDVNPLSYLPSGGNKIRIDRTSTKHGVAKAKRAARAKAKAAQRKRSARERKAARVAARAAAKAAKAAPASAVECADDVAVVEAPTQLAGVLYSFSIASSGVGETAEPDAPCEPAPEDPLGTTTAADAGSDPTHEEGSTAVPAGVRSPFRGTSPVPE